MANARIGKELFVKTPNRAGMLYEVTSAIAGLGVNIQALSAHGIAKDAFFRIITSNNKKAKAALKSKKYNVTEKAVVLLDLTNKPGIVKKLSAKLKKANINLSYIYGTTYGKGKSLIIFNSNNNAKAAKLLR